MLELHSFFMLYGRTAVFRVEVWKDDGTGRVAMYEQAVTIVAGDPPDLNIV